MRIQKQSHSARLTIDAALNQLNEINQTPLSSIGAWTPYAIFTHCAQSVECSILGYPIQRPKLIQNTVGQAIFSLFSLTGRMFHPLDEPIPGAPELSAQGNIETAIARLTKALIYFDQYSGPLAPHFTYGVLTKDEYILAHGMHLNNHLEEVRFHSTQHPT